MSIFKAIKKHPADDIIEQCEQYRADLVKYCVQFFDCEPEYAEDCVQEAYTELYAALSRGTKIHNPKAWLYKVVLNYKNKTVRDIIKRNEQEFSTTEEKELAIQNALTYEPDYTDETVTDETIKEQAMIIISSLNKEERYLYFSYYRDKKNLKEIAEEMGISHAAARQRHAELRKKIIGKVKEFEKN